jgi:hypothetical protein
MKKDGEKDGQYIRVWLVLYPPIPVLYINDATHHSFHNQPALSPGFTYVTDGNTITNSPLVNLQKDCERDIERYLKPSVISAYIRYRVAIGFSYSYGGRYYRLRSSAALMRCSEGEGSKLWAFSKSSGPAVSRGRCPPVTSFRM